MAITISGSRGSSVRILYFHIGTMNKLIESEPRPYHCGRPMAVGLGPVPEFLFGRRQSVSFLSRLRDLGISPAVHCALHRMAAPNVFSDF